MVLGGMDNQNIASSLSLSLSTVKVHIHNILRKTGCRDRQELRQDYWDKRVNHFESFWDGSVLTHPHPRRSYSDGSVLTQDRAIWLAALHLLYEARRPHSNMAASKQPRPNMTHSEYT